MIRFIQNIGEYFSANYFDEDFPAKVLKKSGHAAEDLKDFNSRITGLKARYYRFRSNFTEKRGSTKHKVTDTHRFHTQLLNALGYAGEQHQYDKLFHLNEKTVLPVRHTLYRGEQTHLMILEMQALISNGTEEPDGLFEQRYDSEEEGPATVQKYHRAQWSNVFTVEDGLRISPMIINKAVSELFLLEPLQRPRYILLCAGNIYYLLEQEKWFRGSYLQFDLEELFLEAEVAKNKNYSSVFHFMLGKETLAPDADMVLMEQLDEDSHKSAYEVTKDLKEGVIHAVEALANEIVRDWKKQGRDVSAIAAEDLKNDCLNIVYRLLFLFYAEARPDLDILPADDPVYQHGYSLEMLRELEQVPLHSANTQEGHFFHHSLCGLFRLLSSGYREEEQSNRSFAIRQLDSPLFDDSKLHYFPKSKISNSVWQLVICELSLARKQKGKARGRISYANLGINQLGSVYESLLAFRGFFAETDYIEVHRKRKGKETSAQVASKDGSYLVPRHRLNDFDLREVYHEREEQMRIIHKDTFIYRLSGRDRQKSASYYTPEVLTQCTVKYTLKPILERLDRGEMKALDLLDLKILEPAMGAAAFHNEVINQLADAYLSYRQEELKQKKGSDWRISPGRYREELQKIKAWIALNNVYGVDLNPTAVELGKLSLWLNVIHRDMQTPFFAGRLAVGNAVVGAWLKVYPEKLLAEEYSAAESLKPVEKRKPLKKEWWTKAPKQLKFTRRGIKRKAEEIYHFLLPDKNMLPSGNIKLLKQEHPEEALQVRDWRNAFCTPLSPAELDLLQRICAEVDQLLELHYRFQASVKEQTRLHPNFWGSGQPAQTDLGYKTYSEKETLASLAQMAHAPYYKLKLLFDYWCSFWFWDMREAALLPTRQQWYADVLDLLNLPEKADQPITPDIERSRNAGATEAEPADLPTAEQGSLFGDNQQLVLRQPGSGKKEETLDLRKTLETQRPSRFTNPRKTKVEELARQYRFFHYQLEFVEVFRERNGFDVIVGNPPWVKVTFEEKDIISEKYPDVLIRKTAATKLNQYRTKFFEEDDGEQLYKVDLNATESTIAFLNGLQNFPDLVGQQTNLYRCFLTQALNITNPRGSAGLLHPEGVYDDPKGGPLRKTLYQRLKFHFQFQNQMLLFEDVGHRFKFSINVYQGESSDPDFSNINNLFHPSTIDGCFIHDGAGEAGGMKIKLNEEYEWNTAPHRDRIIHYQELELLIIAQALEDHSNWESAKLALIHHKQLLDVLSKMAQSQIRVRNMNMRILECWHETNDVKGGKIQRQTSYIDPSKYEMIYSGPHFFLGNPLYKNPMKICTEKSHYDTIDLISLEASYLGRTNYIPTEEGHEALQEINGFKTGINKDGIPVFDHWVEHFKTGIRRRLNQAGERTLIPAILPPGSSHVNPVISCVFQSQNVTVELAGLLSSIAYDFLIKTTGATDLVTSRLRALPIGLNKNYVIALNSRTLLLNCLNQYYAPLWERQWQEAYREDTWSKTDARLKPFEDLKPTWEWATPLRNWFERRQALVEIDVIVAMALGLTLEELSLIYNVQFPVLQQNEDDTWYDSTGNIVFTCSKGLTGVGVDRAVWNTIKDLKAGETYEHTIEKSELYYGKKVIYQAPFDRCNRVDDYRTAWAHFEKVFSD